MKYALLRFISFVIPAIVIILTEDFSGWLWGIIVAVAMFAFAIAWQVLTAKEQIAKEEKEYELWVKEMEARANYRIEEF